MKEETDSERHTLDNSNFARTALSVLGWNEACHSTGRVAVDGFTQPGGPARPFYPVYRRVRSARRVRLDSPGLLRIRPRLIPLAATGLVIIMIGATVLTIIGDGIAFAVIPFVTGLLVAFVAYGRWQLVPHRGRTGRNQ
jgi:hypothetical protein